MQWTGNIGRTFGQVLLAVGIMAFVLGLVGLLIGAWLVDSATEEPQAAQDIGDVLEVIVPWSLLLLPLGAVGVVAGIVILGVARGLRERLQRRTARAAEQAAEPLPPPQA